MQQKLRHLAVITALLATTVIACKKSSTNEEETYSDQKLFTELAVQSKDQVDVSGEIDAVTNDANLAVEEYSAISGGKFLGVLGTICDATVTVDSASNPRKVTITYNGTNCIGNRKRTGTVILSMPATKRWRDAGTAITVTYQNLKITRVADNKSLTLNGTHVLMNVSGGLLIGLPARTSITHTITSSNMSITFDDGTQRTWQVARQRVYTYNNGIVITITGTHTEGSKTGIAEWGTTRAGQSFTTSIAQPLVIRQDCLFRLTAGQVQHEQRGTTATTTFGLNADGVATGCPGNGTYYCKLVWTGPNNISRTAIVAY
jgi:hypothetical protein